MKNVGRTIGYVCLGLLAFAAFNWWMNEDHERLCRTDDTYQGDC